MTNKLKKLFLFLILLSTGALWTASWALAQPPRARAAASCGVGSGRGYGYTYLTSLKVTRTKCSTAKRVAKRHGHVRGWRCSKKRLATSPVQYNDRETCAQGSRRVVWTFTQNT
jgi:hypothetical protein